jgi:lipoprotein-releasing system permease protein
MNVVLFIALRQLWKRKGQNGIAVGGVALGVAVLITMSAIMGGFQMKFIGEILKISPHVTIFNKTVHPEQAPVWGNLPGTVVQRVYHRKPSENDLRIKRPHDIVRTLRAMPEVEAACANIVGQAIVSFGSKDLGADLRGVVAREQDDCTPVSEYMKEGTWEALQTNTSGVVLGAILASDLGAHEGDQIRVLTPGGAPRALKVVGVFETGIPPVDRVRIYVPRNTAQAVLQRPDTINRIELRLRDPEAGAALAASLERLIGYDAEGWREANKNYLSLYDLQNTIIKMVEAAILVVGGFGILAIQIMIVLQKTRDIAILRSVGLRRSDILFTFLIQGIILSLLGAAIGDLLGWRLVEFLGTLKVKVEGPLVRSPTFMVYKTSIVYLYGFVFALLTGVAASLMPAWRASRVEPVDVLRGQI